MKAFAKLEKKLGKNLWVTLYSSVKYFPQFIIHLWYSWTEVSIHLFVKGVEKLITITNLFDFSSFFLTVLDGSNLWYQKIQPLKTNKLHLVTPDETQILILEDFLSTKNQSEKITLNRISFKITKFIQNYIIKIIENVINTTKTSMKKCKTYLDQKIWHAYIVENIVKIVEFNSAKNRWKLRKYTEESFESFQNYYNIIRWHLSKIIGGRGGGITLGIEKNTNIELEIYQVGNFEKNKKIHSNFRLENSALVRNYLQISVLEMRTQVRHWLKYVSSKVFRKSLKKGKINWRIYVLPKKSFHAMANTFK